jgi:hypothetical protein
MTDLKLLHFLTIKAFWHALAATLPRPDSRYCTSHISQYQKRRTSKSVMKVINRCSITVAFDPVNGTAQYIFEIVK